MVSNRLIIRIPTSTQRLLSGAFGGMCSVSATHPLDTIRVRLQMGLGFPPLSLKSLYRGVLPPVIGVAPISAACFAGYDYAWKWTKDYQLNTFQHNFIAGSFAGKSGYEQ